MRATMFRGVNAPRPTARDAISVSCWRIIPDTREGCTRPRRCPEHSVGKACRVPDVKQEIIKAPCLLRIWLRWKSRSPCLKVVNHPSVHRCLLYSVLEVLCCGCPKPLLPSSPAATSTASAPSCSSSYHRGPSLTTSQGYSVHSILILKVRSLFVPGVISSAHLVL